MTNLVVDRKAERILETMGQVHDVKPPKPDAISTDFEWVTPAKAAEWLASNSNDQRQVSPSTVAKFVNDMRNGLWDSRSHQAMHATFVEKDGGPYSVGYAAPPADVVVGAMCNLQDHLAAVRK